MYCQFAFLQVAVPCIFTFGAVLGIAPGDETCSLRPRTSDTNVLVDSYNYVALLLDYSGNNTWTALDIDGNGLTWTKGTGGNCQGTVMVNSSASSANDWLFTQLISKNVTSNVNTYPINISLYITLRFNSCPSKALSVYKYVANPSVASAYDTSKYSIIANITTSANTFTELMFNISFTIQPEENYFYIAFRSRPGTCINTLTRVIIYRSTVQSKQVGLLAYPEVPVPLSVSASVPGVCSMYSSTVSGGPPILNISAQGKWLNDGAEQCYCSPGYQYENNMCTICTAGTFKSTLSNTDTCQQCPLNSMSTQQGAAVCPCNAGYIRPAQQPAQDCIQPPSSPQIYSVNITASSITPCWVSPSNAGGRPQDLYYNIYIQKIIAQGSLCPEKVNNAIYYTGAGGGATCSTIGGLESSLYAVYVVAANKATFDPNTVCNITVIDGRYLAIVAQVQNQTQLCASNAETSTTISSAGAVVITFFITLIVAVMAVIVAIVITWNIARSHEKEFNLASNTTSNISETKFAEPKYPPPHA